MLQEEIPSTLSQFVPSFLHSDSSGHRESAVNETEIDPVLLELPLYRALHRHAKIKIGCCDGDCRPTLVTWWAQSVLWVAFSHFWWRFLPFTPLPQTIPPRCPRVSTLCAWAQAWPNRIQPKGLVPQLGKQKGAGLCPETCGCWLTEVSWRLGKVVAGSLGKKRYWVMAAKAKAEEVGGAGLAQRLGV